MAYSGWSAHNIIMEDLQNLLLPDLNFDDYVFDTNSSEPQSPPQSGDSAPAPAVSSRTVSTASSISCTNNPCSCGRTFRRRSDLKKHIDQRTRPYPCTAMGCTVRAFSSKHDRDRHQREVHGANGAHAAGQPMTKLPCPITSCKRHTRGFARKENLALHVRNMHPRYVPEQPEPEYRGVLAQLSPQTPSSSNSPVTAALPLSPAETHSTWSPSLCSATADAALFSGLSDRLVTLHAQREALARQLASVDETIEAVTKTMEGLQDAPAVNLITEWENWDWVNM